MKYKAIAFDMDGVLIENHSSWIAIHNYFGIPDTPYMNDYLSGRIDYPEFMRKDIALWPKTTIDVIENILQDLKYMKGAKEVCAAIKKMGMRLVLISAGINILAKKVGNELGFDHVFSNGLEVGSDGFLTGNGIFGVDLIRKDKILDKLSIELGISLNEFVAVGDSVYDISMLKKAGLSIAFNSKSEELKKIAKVIVEGKNLSNILNHIE
jgi:phosphoserine phosphatase